MTPSDASDFPEAARRIARAAGIDAPLRVTATPGRTYGPDGSNALVHPGEGRRPLAISVDGNGDVSSAQAHRIALRLRGDDGDRYRMDAEHAVILGHLADAASTLDEPPILALQDVERSDHLPLASHLLIVRIIDHALVRRHVRFHRVTMGSSRALGAGMAFEQTHRNALLTEAGGDRLSALTCCPVAASMLAGGGEEDIARLQSAMAGAGPAEIFLHGVYRPSLRLGDATWQGDRLTMPGRLPAMLETAIVGKKLGDLISHPHVPRNAVVVRALHSRSRNVTVLRTDAAPVPMRPVLAAAGFDAVV